MYEETKSAQTGGSYGGAVAERKTISDALSDTRNYLTVALEVTSVIEGMPSGVAQATPSSPGVEALTSELEALARELSNRIAAISKRLGNTL